MMNSTASLFTPDYSHLTGLLKHLNAEELKDILNNDEKSESMVHDLKQVKDIEAEKEILLASNRSISEYNMSKKPIIEEHRNQLEETRKIALELRDSLLEKKKKIESCKQATSKETLLALLQTAALESDEKAEEAVEFFLKSEMSVEDFLEKYLELRKVAHLRRIKAEKLAIILQQDGGGASFQPSKPQKLRKPPPPPVPQSPWLPHVPASMNQNSSPVPARSAPQPPMQSSVNAPYPMYVPNMQPPIPNMQQPAAPFTYCSPYPRYPMARPPPRYPQFR